MATQEFRNIFPETVPNSLSSEYISFELWVKSRLGDDVASVELSPQQVWWALQEADQEFSAEVNTVYMKNYMSHFYGMSQNQNAGGIYPNFTYSYLTHITQGIGDLAGIGGDNRDFLGYITLVADQQDYPLDTCLYDRNGVLVDFTNGVEIKEVYYNDLDTTSRYIDTWSYYNIMAGEFGVQSALYNTMFAMLPVNANVMMMQHVRYNNKLRLSNYTYEMYGDQLLRIFPSPNTSDKKIYIRFRHKQPIDSTISITGSASGGTVTANDTNIVGNFAQVKLDPFNWDSLNGIAKRWVRMYGLAICKEILAFNRGKFKEIPFASENNMVQLNWDMLSSQAKEEQKQLKDLLREDLKDIMNNAELLKRDADALEQVQRQLTYVPLFPYWR